MMSSLQEPSQKARTPDIGLANIRKLDGNGEPIGGKTVPLVFMPRTSNPNLKFTCLSIAIFILGFTFLFCVGTVLFFPYPLRAACDLQWYFASPCCPVRTLLSKQMAEWETNANCTGIDMRAEGCRYRLLSTTKCEIKGRHYSLEQKFIDDITLKFDEYANGGCVVTARSATQQNQFWPLMTDMGTNYCNLRNLIEATGLSKTTAFHEETENKKCTQFSETVCGVTYKRKCNKS